MVNPVLDHPDILERMANALENVWRRRKQTVLVLEKAGIEYAVLGGNAVAAWVKTIDAGGVRGTPSVDNFSAA
jgi:hypothetical protein